MNCNDKIENLKLKFKINNTFYYENKKYEVEFILCEKNEIVILPLGYNTNANNWLSIPFNKCISLNDFRKEKINRICQTEKHMIK